MQISLFFVFLKQKAAYEMRIMDGSSDVCSSDLAESRSARYLFDEIPAPESRAREATGWLELQDIHRHNLHGVNARIPLGVLTAVTGISGSGKSSLVAQALPELVLLHLGQIGRAHV